MAAFSPGFRTDAHQDRHMDHCRPPPLYSSLRHTLYVTLIRYIYGLDEASQDQLEMQHNSIVNRCVAGWLLTFCPHVFDIGATEAVVV